MNKIQNQIQPIENLITNAKLSLKHWAKQIGEYHKILKGLTNQLASLKKQITMNENNNKTPGGNN